MEEAEQELSEAEERSRKARAKVHRIRKVLRRAETTELKKFEWEVASLKKAEKVDGFREESPAAAVSLPDQSVPGNPLMEFPLDVWSGDDPLLDFASYGSSEDLPVPPICAKPEATMESNSPIVDPLAASNEESISLSSNPRSRLPYDDVSSATLSAREKGDDSGAALGCKPLAPLTSDVSQDDGETEIETVRMEPDRVVKPAAVESDTDDGASSITDEPFSSPLAHKGRRIRQTSTQRAPTPAIPKTTSRLHPHVVKRDRHAKGSSQIERPGDAIRASYGKFGLNAQRLIIVPEAQPFNLLALFMSSAAKVGAKLTPPRMKVLQKRRDELLASWPIPVALCYRTPRHLK
ncbi:hypothetical protein LTR53_015916 [Teratosphaeriaceae sp. CCFEE 6253]|nr:hypothetical protein LTR53_015916 [Teratosphaeriaceae sp. CCFEE 6253]